MLAQRVSKAGAILRTCCPSLMVWKLIDWGEPGSRDEVAGVLKMKGSGASLSQNERMNMHDVR